MNEQEYNLVARTLYAYRNDSYESVGNALASGGEHVIGEKIMSREAMVRRCIDSERTSYLHSAIGELRYFYCLETPDLNYPYMSALNAEGKVVYLTEVPTLQEGCRVLFRDLDCKQHISEVLTVYPRSGEFEASDGSVYEFSDILNINPPEQPQRA